MNIKTTAAIIVMVFVMSALIISIPADGQDIVEDVGTVTLTYPDGNSTTGMTFTNAANQATNGAGYTITLESDVTLNNSCGSTDNKYGFWTIDKSLTLDLQTYTLTINSGHSKAIAVSGDGTKLTINGTGTVTYSGSTCSYLIFCTLGGETEINGATIKTMDTKYCFQLNGNDTVHTKLTLNSGTIEAANIYAIYSNRGDITINGGTVKNTRTDGNVISIANNTAVVNIAGGTVEGGFVNKYKAPIIWSDGTLEGNIAMDTILVPDGSHLVVSGNSSDGYSYQFNDSAPENYTASLGNMYFTTDDGPQLALDCLGLMTDMTFNSLPAGGITFTLEKIGDSASVLLQGNAVGAAVTVNAGTGCAIKESQADDGRTIYTAQIEPSLAEAIIVETGDYYATFEEAMTAVQDGQTIRLCKNVESDKRLIVSHNYTLDLYGYNLTSPASQGGQIGAYEVTIQDTSPTYSLSFDDTSEAISYTGGTIIFTGDHVNGTFYLYHNEAVLNLKSGCIQADHRAVVISLGTFNMSGGYIKAANGIIVLGGDMSTHVGVANITGGVIEASIAVQGNGSQAYGNTNIDISNTTIICDGNGSFTYAIYHPQRGTLNITDSTIICNDGAGIVARAGDITISNTTIKTTGMLTGTAGDASTIVSSSALVYDLSANYPGLSSTYGTSIQSGTFASDSGVDAISCIEGSVSNNMSISGGTFSSNVYEYCADGMTTLANSGEGTYIVGTKPTVTVTVETDQTVVQTGTEITLTAIVTGVPEGYTPAYTWKDGSSDVGSDLTYTVTPTADTTYTFTVTLADYGDGLTFTDSVAITVAENVVTVSVSVDGASQDYNIVAGETLPAEAIPQSKTGYTYRTSDGRTMDELSEQTFSQSASVVIANSLNSPTSVTFTPKGDMSFGESDDRTLTAVATHEVDGVSFHYQWYNNGTAIQDSDSTTYVVSEGGTYTVSVWATDGTYASEALMGTDSAVVTFTSAPVQNEDGSSTETTTNPDGSTTETTTNPDGSTTTTTTTPETTLSNGNTMSTTTTVETSCSESTTTITTTVSVSENSEGVTADEIQQASQAAVNAAAGTDTVPKVEISTSGTQVAITSNALQSAGDVTLVISTSKVSVVADGEMLESLADAEGNLTFVLEEVAKDDLHETHLGIAGDSPIYSLTVLDEDDNEVPVSGNIPVTIKDFAVPDHLDTDTLVMCWMDDDGRLTPRTTQYDASTKELTFWTPHFSLYVPLDQATLAQLTQSTPSLPLIDDDEDEVAVGGTTSGKDDSTTVVACAAAAVVAALMAAFLIIDRRN